MLSSSLAHTKATSATDPLVIHILFPLIIQSSPSFLHVVTIPPGFDPKLGSVNPKHPIFLPAPKSVNHLSFWLSEPNAFGSDSQKERWLTDLGAGKKIGCFGLTEPNFGSNPGGMVTTCKKDGDDWIINGNKMWITNGSVADVALVWAKDEDNIIRGFLIEKGTKGFTSSDLHGKFSLRASITSELSMSDVRVPDSSRLPNIEGLKGPLSCLTQARYGIAWGMVGAAVDCYNTALNYSKERKQFSKPIAAYQLTQQKIAEMVTKITESQLLVYRLGRLKDENKMTFQQVSLAKRNNCLMARDISKTAREMLGGNGITIDYSPIRHMANIESVFTYEGTHEMHTLIIGEHETSLMLSNDQGVHFMRAFIGKD